MEKDGVFDKIDEAILEIPGYKLINVEIVHANSGEIQGYVSDMFIKSKDIDVDYVQFDILNMDKIPGKLVGYHEKVYAGRIEFTLNDYRIVIDKSYNFNKELNAKLISKNGSIITHTGRIFKLNGTTLKTKKVDELLSRLSLALSFSCGRYIAVANASGYLQEEIKYRAWYKNTSNNYGFVFNWTSTISNYHNFEKYLTLMLKKIEDSYYYDTIANIMDWYIESLNGINMGNNIISIQTALEMLSYVVLVETDDIFTNNEYDNRAANQNIRELLRRCGIDSSIPKGANISNIARSIFNDSVDLITFYRNSVVHPSKTRGDFYLEFEDMWNIILIGISYIELVLLYLIKYKGEYTNRFVDFRFGDVNLVPWSSKKIFLKK